MATDFENLGNEAVPKTFSRIKMSAESEERVPEALRPILEIKMVADLYLLDVGTSCMDLLNVIIVCTNCMY